MNVKTNLYYHEPKSTELWETRIVNEVIFINFVNNGVKFGKDLINFFHCCKIGTPLKAKYQHAIFGERIKYSFAIF
jgi:hypothetical protein